MRCADGCVKQVRGEPDFDACSLSSWLVSSGPVAGCPRCLPAGSAKPPGPSEGPAVPHQGPQLRGPSPHRPSRCWWRCPGCSGRPWPSDPVAHSDHPSAGPATPLPGSYGTLPTAARKAAGDALGASLHASSGRTGVHYLIWYGRSGNADRAREGWRPYHGAGVYTSAPSTPAGITGGHCDHVHIWVY